MSIYFKRLKVGHPKPLTCPPDWDGCWKIYTILDALGSRAVRDVQALKPPDDECARKTLTSFTNKAHTGQPLSDLYDNKQCHEAHSYTQANGHEVKIFRIWGTGKIRVYFIYLQDKNIVILKIEPKRVDTLSDGEKKVLADIAQEILTCVATYGFESRIKAK